MHKSFFYLLDVNGDNKLIFKCNCHSVALPHSFISSFIFHNRDMKYNTITVYSGNFSAFVYFPNLICNVLEKRKYIKILEIYLKINFDGCVSRIFF